MQNENLLFVLALLSAILICFITSYIDIKKKYEDTKESNELLNMQSFNRRMRNDSLRMELENSNLYLKLLLLKHVENNKDNYDVYKSKIDRLRTESDNEFYIIIYSSSYWTELELPIQYYDMFNFQQIKVKSNVRQRGESTYYLDFIKKILKENK